MFEAIVPIVLLIIGITLVVFIGVELTFKGGE